MRNRAEPTGDPKPAGPGPASAPSIALPKGGGAVRGIGEKFTASPATGSGAVAIPIPVSPARGLEPELALNYDSNSGNGPFGLGWSLSLPSITRKTDRGIPKYDDTSDSDVFILSGAEDLIPAFRKNERGDLTPDGDSYVIHEDERGDLGYVVRRYRPRTEGLFARIERWTRNSDGDVHWRTISRDNVTSLYGLAAGRPDALGEASRIGDPEDSQRVFSWLLCMSYDDKGNAVEYRYIEESAAGVDGLAAHEENRAPTARIVDRYIKSVRYGNQKSLLAADETIPPLGPDLSDMQWHFEIIFDYDEGHTERAGATAKGEHVRAHLEPQHAWTVRPDPFSRYRAGFETRTYRRCTSALLFHHFERELPTPDYLVRSLSFEYADSAVASRLTSVTQSGYVLAEDGASPNRFLQRSLPPVEFAYSETPLREIRGDTTYVVEELVGGSLENAPGGTLGGTTQWVDLDGEGIAGLLIDEGESWAFKPNLGGGRLGGLRRVTSIPSSATQRDATRRLLDLDGDGRIDLVELDPSSGGFYERDANDSWEARREFGLLPNIDWRDPGVSLTDVTGDGRTDVLVAEPDRLTWYEGLGEGGFALGGTIRLSDDERAAPRVVFTDPNQAVFLADMSGDGLADVVRVTRGEVCYWPGLGYGRFSRKVTLSDSPWLGAEGEFEPRRVLLADTDGSGIADLIYHGGSGVEIYLNLSGNALGGAQVVDCVPQAHALSSLASVDLLGEGTICLVWSSALPGETNRSLKYVDLMKGVKPHLLTGIINNLGAETRIGYASSTQHYLRDKAKGKAWITRLPFPVHVVTRVETHDHISQNRFLTTYAFHHGHFDGVEREFRGFGMVEQWDCEHIGSLSGEGQAAPEPTGSGWPPSVRSLNVGPSDTPPVLTRTWFHTGVFSDASRISTQFGEEYGSLSGSVDGAVGPLLPDTVLPPGLSSKDAREACRALRGHMLRQEVYGLDGHPTREDFPYVVTEQNFGLQVQQPRGTNSHTVVFAHPRESISSHFERAAEDPRVGHSIHLHVDEFGNSLESVKIGYGRKSSASVEDGFSAADVRIQGMSLLSWSQSAYTNHVDEPDAHRLPQEAHASISELRGVKLPEGQSVYRAVDFIDVATAPGYSDPPSGGTEQRLVDCRRTYYRHDDLSGDLPAGKQQARGLIGRTLRGAFTAQFASVTYGERVSEQIMQGAGYVRDGGDTHWWAPSGRVFHSPDERGSELYFARHHFFTERRFRDPFHRSRTRTETLVERDRYDLLPMSVTDALANRVSTLNDYRVLQPSMITDANGNRSFAIFDALGMVSATAVAGKEGETKGDSLDGVEADLALDLIRQHADAPKARPHDLLRTATTRLVYDLHAYVRTRDAETIEPPFVSTLVREKHESDLESNELPRIQYSFSYSDGFGREIQKKVQAEPGPVPRRDSEGHILADDDGRPDLVEAGTAGRWVGSGWTVFNNKGLPVRQFESFFTDTHKFDFDVRIGVSPTLFYDPAGRIVARLHPNRSWEKTTFDAWSQATWDVNDTVHIGSRHRAGETGQTLPSGRVGPRLDPDVGGWFAGLEEREFLPTWYDERMQMGGVERRAAQKTAAHADSPTRAFFDPLGRLFLTIADNRQKDQAGAQTGEFHPTRTKLDIKGDPVAVTDARGNRVMSYRHDLRGLRAYSDSMDGGERWMLPDVLGKSLLNWDSRSNRFRVRYDRLRRPIATLLSISGRPETALERTIHGEWADDPELRNLRGRVHQVRDQAGLLTLEAYDFKGNPIRQSRQVLSRYWESPDWSQEPGLSSHVYESSTKFDALDRSTHLTSPDGSVVLRTYNEAGLLETVTADLEGVDEHTTFVANIDRDAKGQRTSVEYGNGVVTTYGYERETSRLSRLSSRRDPMSYRADCPDPPRSGWPGCGLQDLSYTYDPVGNISSLRDDAHQAIFFRNMRVDPGSGFTYDSVYRLIEAKGRERIGQQGQAPPPRALGSFRTPARQPGDGNLVRRYRQMYAYDKVGNIRRITHHGSEGWTREFGYSDDNNRLLSTRVGNGPRESYRYDGHGNMVQMGHLDLIRWSRLNELSRTQRGDERTYYQYDAQGQRVRKVTIFVSTGRIKTERIYLDGFEVYRRYNAGGQQALERETLHIADDQQRIALVERRTVGTVGEEHLIRYQLGNHLDSAALELAGDGSVLSYEEYFPFGGTSYQAVSRQLDRNPKRYRYTGKERDEQTGFYYHGARYYACWLGRWTSPDPMGLVDGVNVFAFVRNSPVANSDPTGTQSLEGGNYGWGLLWREAKALGESLIESAVGGHANVNFEKNTIEYSGPVGGVGGAAGGLARAVTFRLIPAERNMSWASRAGMEMTAPMIPVADAFMSLATGESVSGLDTSRLTAGVTLALDLLPLIPYSRGLGRPVGPQNLGRRVEPRGTLADPLPPNPKKTSQALPYVPDPKASGAAHSVVGTRLNPKKSAEPYRTAITFDEHGNPMWKVDVTSHPVRDKRTGQVRERGDHANPHFHPFDPEMPNAFDPDSPGNFRGGGSVSQMPSPSFEHTADGLEKLRLLQTGHYLFGVSSAVRTHRQLMTPADRGGRN